MKSREMTSPAHETLHAYVDRGQTVYTNGTPTSGLQNQPRNPAHERQHPAQEVSLLAVSHTCRKEDHYGWPLVQEAKQ